MTVLDASVTTVLDVTSVGVTGKGFRSPCHTMAAIAAVSINVVVSATDCIRDIPPSFPSLRSSRANAISPVTPLSREMMALTIERVDMDHLRSDGRDETPTPTVAIAWVGGIRLSRRIPFPSRSHPPESLHRKHERENRPAGEDRQAGDVTLQRGAVVVDRAQ